MKILRVKDEIRSLQLSELLSGYDHFLSQIPEIDIRESLVNYHAHQINLSLRKDDRNELFICTEDDHIIGMSLFEHLPIDSSLFWFSMARISFSCAHGDYNRRRSIYDRLAREMVEKATTIGVMHISCRLSASDLPAIHTLEDHAFRLMDTLGVFSQALSRRNAYQGSDEFNIRDYHSRDHEILRKLAREVFSERDRIITRYFADPHLDNEKCRQVYENWLENLVKDEHAKTFVCEMDGRAVGFYSCQSDVEMNQILGVNICHILLAGVDKQYRDKGIYIALKRTQALWASERFQVAVSYVHPGNPIVHMVGMFGSKIRFMFHTLHCWLGD